MSSVEIDPNGRDKLPWLDIDQDTVEFFEDELTRLIQLKICS